MIIKIVYTVFLALMVALFVGLGIDAFYPGPKQPDYPIELSSKNYSDSCQETTEDKALRLDYEKKQKQYEQDFKTYSRNVSMVSLLAAIAILVVSLTLLSRIKMIADGILLGGVFTTCYAIIRGLMAEDSRFRFVVVCFGLAIALTLGYIKFIRPKMESENSPQN